MTPMPRLPQLAFLAGLATAPAPARPTEADPFDGYASPNHSTRTEPVQIVVVHWTGGTFRSAVDWVCRDESDVSYHEVGARDGSGVQLVPYDRAAWACGFCRSSNPARFPYVSGNSASDNIALAGGPPTKPTEAQLTWLVDRIVARFRARGWRATETWRITDHAAEAIYPRTHRKAGQRGRKPDVTGSDWLDLDAIRARVAAQLTYG